MLSPYAALTTRAAVTTPRPVLYDNSRRHSCNTWGPQPDTRKQSCDHGFVRDRVQRR